MKTYLREQLRPALLAGENLVWVDRPEGGIKFRLRDLFLIPFSFAWGGGALFALWAVLREREVAVIPVIMLFALFGLYFMFGRFAHDVWIRNRTVYGITDKGRILIKTGIMDSNFYNFQIKRLPMLKLKAKSNGSGSIRLQELPISKYQIQGSLIEDYQRQLDNIPKVREVYQLIKQYR
ncbi:MAG: hypothetical protein AAFQ87_23910 [Bacteroidota bacterium]